MILLFQESLLTAPIYHALVASQSHPGVYKTNFKFFFSNKSKLEDAVHEHTKLSLTVKGTQNTTEHQNRTLEIPHRSIYSVDASFSRHAGETQLCTSVMSLCNFLTHTPCNRRAGDNGADCHRKLRGRGGVMLGVTGLILQRGQTGDLPLPTSKPEKNKKARPAERRPNLTNSCSYERQARPWLPKGHPA